MAYLQYSKQFDRVPLIGPCLHTIHNQDLMVPLEGFEDGLTGPPSSLMQRDRLGRRLFLTAMLDKKVFFQRQSKNAESCYGMRLMPRIEHFGSTSPSVGKVCSNRSKRLHRAKSRKLPIISSALLRSNKSPAIT